LIDSSAGKSRAIIVMVVLGLREDWRVRADVRPIMPALEGGEGFGLGLLVGSEGGLPYDYYVCRHSRLMMNAPKREEIFRFYLLIESKDVDQLSNCNTRIPLPFK